MNRNEKLKKRFEAKMNKPERFDATPYIDIIMDKLEDEDNEIEKFLTIVTDNPELSFIFGKSSLLNTAQKSQVLMELTHRLTALIGFESTVYLEELTDLNMHDSPEFEKFQTMDEDGVKIFDFDFYFEQYDLTREQKTIIIEDFYKLQSERAKIGRRKVIPTILLSILLTIIPPFFIPNLLQKWGVLPENTGWLMKIFIGLLSLIVLYFFISRLTSIIINRILEKEKI